MSEVKGYKKVSRAPKKKSESKFCPAAKLCGGCQIEDISYSEQLKKKEAQAQKILGKFCKIHEIIGMENPYHYRNSVRAVIERDKRNTPISGVYQPGTNFVVKIEECMLEDAKAHEIISSIRGLLQSFKIKIYDRNTGYGLLQHVLVKRGFYSGEILVVLVTASPVFPSKNNFVAAIRKLHPEITTIVQNVNARGYVRALGDKEKALYGKGYIEDTICGYTFCNSSKTIYPVNTAQAETVYKKAVELAGLTGKERVFDINCQIGVISIMASQFSKQVIGIDSSKDAVREAVKNAKKNQISNIRFFNAEAKKFLSGSTEEGETVDVIFLNASKAELDEGLMDAVSRMKPKKVIYISQHLDRAEHDITCLTKMRYKAAGAWLIDVLPFKRQTEIVIELCRIQK